MLKRTLKIFLLMSAMSIVAAAQTVVPDRCHDPVEISQDSLTQLLNVPLVSEVPFLMQAPLLPGGFGDSLAALLGQVQSIPLMALSQTHVEAHAPDAFTLAQGQSEDAGPLVFSLGAGSYLGVYLDEVTGERAKTMSLREERGAVVTKVIDDSPAAKAGIKENDVIVSFNGRPVDTVRELQRLLSDTPTGRTVSIELIRGGNRLTISATLTQKSFVRPDVWRGHEDAAKLQEQFKHLQDNRKLTEEWMKQFPKGNEFGNFNLVFPGSVKGAMRLGVSIESMSEQLAGFFGAKEGGVLVTEVRENSPAAKAGMKAGDVIVGVDSEKVNNISDIIRALNQKEEGQVNVKVIRDRSEKTLNVTLEKRVRPRNTSMFLRRSVA